MIERYYNLFDPAKHYTQLLFRAGDGLQSRELNEIQTTLMHRLQGVADALLKDGDIVSGANLQIEADTGLVTLETGRVYLRGAVREVPAASFTVPVDGRVAVGVRFSTRTVTELEDPSLREPAVGVRNYQEPGAGRLQETLAWGWEGAGTSDGQPGDFHAVYALDNGILENRRQPPVLDGVIAGLARYDYDANGHYVVDGLGVRYLSQDSDSQEHIFSVAEGRANIDGFKVERTQSQRLRLPIDPDLQRVSSEPQVFNDSGDGSMVVTINRPPLAQVLDIKVTQQKTETVVHGAFTGSRDVLTEPTVVAVLEVTQGGTTYAQGTDYKVVGDEIDWSPGGAEPAPGSSYQVTYQYIASVTPTDLTDTGFKVTGVVQGSTMYIDYQWKLPRVDVLALTADGQVERIKGISQVRNPVAPTVPASRLALAEIAYDWRSGSEPVVRNVAIRTIKVSELTAMQRQIADLYDLIALEHLRVDANIREPAAKKGLFVDNFLDDDLRDQGVAQTGAIVAGVLTLPITASAQHAKENSNALITLDYTLTPVIEQLARTGSMKINPYQAFEPVPARVTLNPAVDQFTVTNTTWASDVTERLITGSGVLEQVVETRRSEQVLASSSEEAQFLRALQVTYRVEGFGPSEALAQLRFDGIGISQPAGTAANAAGLLTGSFQIPQAIPAGAKLVEFLGAGGSYGSATYVGRGQIVTETRRRILTTVVRRWDPLAQTFTLPERRTIGGLELWFSTKGGSAPVVVQIRETQVGMPTTTVLTEGRLLASEIKTDGNATRITLGPVALEANREYALVVLTDDANHAISVAELGKYDPRTGWVTAQPYQIGVLLSSSNGSLWAGVVSGAQSAWQQLTAALGSFAPLQALQSVIGSMLTALSDLPGQFTSLGSAMLQGLAQGVRNAAQQAVAAVGEVAGGVRDRFKAMLGINSPSRVFATLGGALSLGLAQGVAAAGPAVVNEVGQLAQSLQTVPISLAAPEVTQPGLRLPTADRPSLGLALPAPQIEWPVPVLRPAWADAPVPEGGTGVGSGSKLVLPAPAQSPSRAVSSGLPNTPVVTLSAVPSAPGAPSIHFAPQITIHAPAGSDPQALADLLEGRLRSLIQDALRGSTAALHD